MYKNLWRGRKSSFNASTHTVNIKHRAMHEPTDSRSPISHQLTYLFLFLSKIYTQISYSIFTFWHFVSSFSRFSRPLLLHHSKQKRPLNFLPKCESFFIYSQQTTAIHETNRITFSRFVPNQTRWLALRAKKPRKLNCVP